MGRLGATLGDFGWARGARCDVMCVRLYDLLDVLDLVHELYLCHPPDVQELPDRLDHTQQTETETATTETTAGTGTTKGGAR